MSEDNARVPVTAAWLAEMRRRRAAYTAQRARWTAAWQHGGQPEPPTETERRGGGRGSTIFDRRQYRFDL